MADSKVINLTEAVGLNSIDYFYISQDDVDKKINVDNIFSNIPENKLKVGTDQLIVTGDYVGIGIASPAYALDIYNEETRNVDWENYIGIHILDEIAPDGAAADSYYEAFEINLSQKDGNTQTIGQAVGLLVKVIDVMDCTGGVDAIRGNVELDNDTDSSKGIWGAISNYKTVAQFLYGCQFDVTNYSYTTGTGVSPLVRGGRFRIQNGVLPGGAGEPTITLAQVVYANILNAGSIDYNSVIGTAIGFQYDIQNNAYSVITDSYGLKLTTPINNGGAGAITNHYGIYLEDQTVAGTTLNYALYIEDGDTYIGGNIGLYGHAPAAQPTKAGHNNWAAISDVVQALVDIGLFDAV